MLICLKCCVSIRCLKHNYVFVTVHAKFGDRLKLKDGEEVLVLTDNLGSPIDVKYFEEIIYQFKGSGSFFVNIEKKDIGAQPIVTSLVCNAYIFFIRTVAIKN